MPSRINRSQRKMKRRSRRSRSRRQNKKQFGGGGRKKKNFDFKVIANVKSTEPIGEIPGSGGTISHSTMSKVESYKLICQDINLNETHPTNDITPELLNIIYEKLEQKVDEMAGYEMGEGNSKFSIINNQDGDKEYVMTWNGEILELNPPLNSLSDLANKELKLHVDFTSAPLRAGGGGRYNKKKTRKSRKSRRSRKSRKSKRSRKSKKKTKRRRY